MSLLDSDNDDPYADEDQPVWRSHTDDPLFSEPPHKGKGKKNERKAKGEDRKNISKPVHWTKQKENVVQEKTPKKSKGQSASKPSISWTPPGSPKSVRPPAESKGRGGVAGATGGAGQLQPSPNVKSHRKRYSQLGAESSSEGEGEGFLLSNKPALRTEGNTDSDHAINPLDRPSNPFLIQPLDPPPPSSSSSLFPAQGPMLGPTTTQGLGPMLGATTTQGPGPMLGTTTTQGPGPMLGTGASTLTPQQLQQQAWDPTLSYITAPAAFELPTTTLPAHALPLVGGVANPLLGTESSPAVQTNPFLSDIADSAFQPTLTFPPPPTTAPPLSTLSLHPDTKEATPPTMAPPPEGVADWSISQELRQKCVQQFQELEPVNGRLTGDKAKEFFIRSKLPSQELSAIW